jgi:kynurenine formamidase
MLPDYDDLPETKAWGLWGEGDRFGCLNLLTADRVVAAAAEVRTGKVFALNWSMGLPDPPLFGRAGYRHQVTGSATSTSHDDVIDNWNTQSSSQWDGFRHIRNHVHGHFDGVADDDHGIDHWARRGIVGRAVLCDVGRWRAALGRPLRYDQPDPIEPSDVVATLAAQGSPVEEGDILLLRTGWVGWYEQADAATRARLADVGSLATPGLRPGEDTARFLWNLHIAAIGADNPAVEVWPPGALTTAEHEATVRADRSRLHEIFTHVILLPLLGLPLGELWDLEALAADCAADGRYRCMFTSAPINLPGGVASPPNALALK